MSNRTLLKSTVILASAGIISKFIGFLLRFPLMFLIGAEGFGLYNYPYQIYAMMIAISINGIPTVISKLVSEKIALDKREEAHKLFIVALKMLIVIGVLASMILYLGGGLLIGTVWPKESYYALQGLIIAPIFVGILSVFRGYFQGMQNMVATSISQIVESLGRLIFGLGLAYMFIDSGISYAAGGATFGATAGAFIGMLTIVIFYLYKKKEIKKNFRQNLHYKLNDSSMMAKTIFRLSIPISIGALAGTIMPMIDSLIIPNRLSTAGFAISESTRLYGNLSGCNIMINLPLSISLAIATSLVPAVAHANVSQGKLQVSSRINQGMRLGGFLAIPSAIGLFVLADPILRLIFPELINGDLILKILSISLIFMAFNQILTSTIQALGHFMRPVKHLFIGSVFKIILSYILLSIPRINILGAAIGTIIGYVISTLLNYLFLRKNLDIKIDNKNIIIKPLVASIIMGFVVNYLRVHVVQSTMCLGIEVLIGIFVYVIVTLLIGGIKIEELRRLVKR